MKWTIQPLFLIPSLALLLSALIASDTDSANRVANRYHLRNRAPKFYQRATPAGRSTTRAPISGSRIG